MTASPTLIPVNRLARAKGRLAELLSPEERETLALITLETVLHAAGDGAVVLTPDDRVRAAVGKRARVMDEDPQARGLNEQLSAAMTRLGPLHELLILHADLPLASDQAVGVVRESAPERGVLLVESLDGGTNAMLLRPPGLFALHYGPGSCALHEAAAKAAGLEVRKNANRELRLDLDTPADIRELLRADRGRQGAAGRYLLSIGVEERLARV